jgi:hypothetical protein
MIADIVPPVVLDICCRKGGATVGYQRAGFYVIGVDIDPQPGYPGGEFIQADGLTVLRLLEFGGRLWSNGLNRWVRPSLIHQSWPCQDGNTQTAGNRARGIRDTHEQFIPQARDLSDRLEIPYVIEQPASSRKGLIRRDLTLCMDTFKGELPPPWVQKHRSFEISGFSVTQPPHEKHAGHVRGWRGRHGNVPGFYREGPYVAPYGDGGGKAKTWELQHAMMIDWMTDHFDLREAIPPAYTAYIGSEFLRNQQGEIRISRKGAMV